MYNYYINEIVKRYRMNSFNKVAKKITNAPCVNFSEIGPIVLSMVHTRDVFPYLAAVKSFSSYVPIAGVVIIADKTITSNDCEIFRKNIPNVEIRQASEFERANIPSGGCWERLVAISNYNKDNYVVQLDADTLTIGPAQRVIELYGKNISFTLGTFDLISKVPVRDVAAWAQSHCVNGTNPHVQLLCESNLIHAAGGDLSASYIRGCAGFAGFGKGSFDEQNILQLSQRMSNVLGEKWFKWGTEQFASNFIISNVVNSEALPHPVYTTPNLINHTTCFVHFIGPLRYSQGKYKNYLLNLLRKLSIAP